MTFSHLPTFPKRVVLLALSVFLLGWMLNPSDVAADSLCQNAFQADHVQEDKRALREPPQAAWSNGRLIQLTSDRERLKHKQVRAVSIVIPVYRELENQNLDRIMLALSQQAEGLQIEVMQVIALVNNDHETAASTQSPVFEENQRTLQRLKEWQKGFAARPLASSDNIDSGSLAPPEIKLIVVDLSTRGYERNMGRIRALGDQVAVGTLRKYRPQIEERDHLVMTMDADIVFGPDFLKETVDLFEKAPEVDIQVASVTYTPDNNLTPQGLRLFHARYFGFLEGHLHDLFTGQLRGVGAPQYTVRASALSSSGDQAKNIRYSPLDLIAEDTNRGDRIQESERLWIRNGYAQITAQARLRSDGFEAAQFEKMIQEVNDLGGDDRLKTRPEVNMYQFLASRYFYSLLRAIRQRRLTFSEALKLFHQHMNRIESAALKGNQLKFGSGMIRELEREFKGRPLRAFEVGVEMILPKFFSTGLYRPGRDLYTLLMNLVLNLHMFGINATGEEITSEIEFLLHGSEDAEELAKQEKSQLRSAAKLFYNSITAADSMQSVRSLLHSHPVFFSGALHPFLFAMAGNAHGSLLQLYPTFADLERAFPNWLSEEDPSMTEFELFKHFERQVAVALARPQVFPLISEAFRILNKEYTQ